MPAMTKFPDTGDAAADRVNQRFHDGYDTARAEAELIAPVLLVLADSIVCLCDGEREERPLAPPAFHLLKSVVHGPVALFVLLHPLSGPLDATTLRQLSSLRTSLAAVSLSDLSADIVANLQGLVDGSLAFVDQVLKTHDVNSAALHDFAQAMGPLLLRSTADATGIQLQALDSAVSHLVAHFTPTQEAAYQVIVTGDHQARRRSLPMQYFGKRFGDHSEERVLYAEGITDEKEALALIGIHRLDEHIAAAFFGDKKRLQRDVLGDAAAAQLQSFGQG